MKAVELISIGTKYGGWTIPSNNDISKEDYILCAGAGEDISFDCGMAMKYGCHVITIDPTPRAIEHYKKLKEAVNKGENFSINQSAEFYDIDEKAMKNIEYYAWGIADCNKKLRFYMPRNPEHVSCSIKNLQRTKEYFEAECYTYETIMKKLGVPRFKLVKIDIEGEEYGVIKNIIRSKNLPRILCVDFDETNNAINIFASWRIRKCFKQLKDAGMVPVYIGGDSATFINEN